MSAKSLVLMFAVVILAVACSPQPPEYFGPPQASLFSIPPEPLFSRVSPAAINSDAFAKRQPLPGQLGYLETIRFINSGMKYIDPFAEFFISPDGYMCFRGLVNRQMLEFENYQNYWCMNPAFVNNVEDLQNSTTSDRVAELFGREPMDQQQHIGGDPSRERATCGD
jgi:hypothetical protein